MKEDQHTEFKRLWKDEFFREICVVKQVTKQVTKLVTKLQVKLQVKSQVKSKNSSILTAQSTRVVLFCVQKGNLGEKCK